LALHLNEVMSHANLKNFKEKENEEQKSKRITSAFCSGWEIS
jgi:hypothetical protein